MKVVEEDVLVGVGRLRQDVRTEHGDMAIAWQHVGGARGRQAQALGEVRGVLC